MKTIKELSFLMEEIKEWHYKNKNNIDLIDYIKSLKQISIDIFKIVFLRKKHSEIIQESK